MRSLSEHATLIPISLITGFLGSGKTTLLGKLLRSPHLSDTAVIINEFGEVGLDHHLIEVVDSETVLIDGGCICCTVRDDLAATLAELHRKRAAGSIPPFRRVVIETTGLADPAPILHTLMTHWQVAPHFCLDGVIATVDAVNGASQFATQPESVKQAAVADRIVLTKSDLASADDVAQLLAQLALLNPGVSAIVAINGDVDPRELLGGGLYDPLSRTANVQAWLRDEALQAVRQDAGRHHHDSQHEHGPSCGDHCTLHEPRHDGGIASHVLTFDVPVEWDVVSNWLGSLAFFHGDDLLRIKGILNVVGEGAPIAIHAVQHLVHEPVALSAWPDEDRRSRIVFITRHLGRDVIEAAWRRTKAEVGTDLAPAGIEMDFAR